MAQKQELQTIDQQAGKFLQDSQTALAGYAIRDYDKTAFLKSAMIAIADNQELSKCVKTPEGKRSIFNALRYASATGLSLNPQEGKSALIAYGGKVQYQVMKNGMIDLALESGKVEFLTADVVRENDEWTQPANPNDNYIYRPARRDRGEIDGFFAVMKLNSGSLHVKWMTIDEVTDHRKKYSPKTQMPEIGYGIKTVMKALLRSVSISKSLSVAVGADDTFEYESCHGAVSPDDVVEALEDKPEPPAPDNKSGSLL